MGDDGNVLYYDYGDDYTSVPICQNPSNCTIKIGKLYCMQIIPQ